MSYIRALSNPENLYIVATGKGRIEFCGGWTRPDGSRFSGSPTMPRHVFEGLLERWNRSDADVKYKGGRLRLRPDMDFRWELSFTGSDWSESLYLYKVTLEYICSRNDFRWSEKSGG